ncbi:F-box/kelch-repeat protein At3g23880-like [Chenopodium quinoa]|uniref:F-box/kelch-repeat protein At3g23880-like n=1 Tax=Chenopodium quinoa TaxID=63459 RepID=UPI000B76D558|nr:F-box/kelch-repeat protein At3g23880-like [Chenopodium quinoa]
MSETQIFKERMKALITLTILDDLIFVQILPRLPVKSLIRFKSVCKNWYYLISTPKFAKSHLDLSFSAPQFLIIDGMPGFELNFYSLSYDESNNLKELVHLDAHVRHRMPHLVFVVGCCNGLVCLYCQSGCGFFFSLWNPATHQYHNILSPIDGFMGKGGFGYVSAIDDYMIVAVIPTSAILSKNIRLWVFSLKAGAWKYSVLSCDNGCEPFEFIKMDRVLINDTLYWTVGKWGNAGCTKSIICCNFVDEQITEIPLPGSGDLVIMSSVINGCLALYRYKIGQPREVWILKQKSDGNSLEKLFSVPCSSVLYPLWMNFSPSGKCLVKHARQLKLVDPAVEDIEPFHGIDFDESVFAVHQHVESLISPFGTSLNDEDNDANITT